MKKIIISITILSFLNLIGCYYQKQMNPVEYAFDEKETLMITTKDSVFSINANDYYMKNDTLFGTLRTKLDAQTTLKTQVEIPVSDIEIIEVERTDARGTTLVVLGAIVGVAGILVLIAAATYDGGGGGAKCGAKSPPKQGI